MLNNFELEHEQIPVPGSPELIMRYYKSKEPQKGIIIFVHGVSHGAWCWGKFVDFFTKEGYDCFAVNLRGHGDNNRNDIKKARLSDYFEDVKRSIDCCKEHCENNKIPYSKPFLLGHSMGGAIVEQYISDYSQEVRAAILLAPVTARGMGIFRAIYTSICPTGLNTVPTVFGFKKSKQLKNPKRSKQRLESLSKSNFFAAILDKDQDPVERITDSQELEYYEENLCSESIDAMWNLKKFDINKPNIPVYVIGSDKDAYFPEDSLNITADFYDTKAEIIKGACHDIMLEPKCEEAAKSIIEFLKNPDDSKYTSSK